MSDFRIAAQSKEDPMQQKTKNTYLVDLNMLNTHNEKGCAACNQKFSLGETVVMACGPWPDECTKLIHENEAVFDDKTGTWYERDYYRSLAAP
jgi:hypothetical protein